MKARTVAACTAFTLCCVLPHPAAAVSVNESAFNDDKHQYLMVHLDSNELANAKQNVYLARQLAAEGATGMLGAVGVPESVTGKASTLLVWPALCDRLAADFRRTAREVPAGQNVTLRYEVNIRGLRALWAASGEADKLVPGSPATKAVIEIVNKLANAFLK